MPDRIECVFELAARRGALSRLRRLDRVRELAAELVSPVEQIQLAAGFDADAIEGDRAGRAAQPQRDRDRGGRGVSRRHDPARAGNAMAAGASASSVFTLYARHVFGIG
jgi:hypothetical protein